CFCALGLSLTVTVSSVSCAAESLSLQPLADTSGLSPAPLRIVGRVVEANNDQDASASNGDTMYRFQWPGVYFETAFQGPRAALRLGEGDAIYWIRVDDAPGLKLVKPAPGVYALEGLSDGAHTLRVEVASENQDRAPTFGGILVPADANAHAPAPRQRMIEFIGDSHTVGYGNTSPTRDSAGDKVWRTTDT